VARGQVFAYPLALNLFGKTGVFKGKNSQKSIIKSLRPLCIP